MMITCRNMSLCECIGSVSVAMACIKAVVAWTSQPAHKLNCVDS